MAAKLLRVGQATGPVHEVVSALDFRSHKAVQALRGTFNPMTRSSAPISLFAEPSISRRSPGSFALSAVAHAAVIGLGYYALTHLPQIEERSVLERFSVRKLDLHTTDPLRMPSTESGSKIPYPGPTLGVPAEVTDAMHSLLISATGRQTLVQPAFHTNLAFTQATPIPTLVIWTPELAARKRIVPPPPSPPTASNVTPSLQLPNEEVKLAQMSITPTDLSARSQVLPVGTTSPVDSNAAPLPQKPPETMSSSMEDPTPTALLSLTDLRMLEGSIFLPQLNDVAPARASGSGSGQAMQAGGADDSDDLSRGANLTTDHITLPKDGRFGVVVVGSSMGDEFPETLATWNNRVAYTAYLHLGLPKNWILQYAVIRSLDAAQAGVVGRVEAPWPYDIVRPNLMTKDLNADALLIHGFLNQAGRLESLAIVFPSGFRYASFVLHALGQWQFRPAQQNGHATAVEVLLTIPDESE
jgi:hypothetical protein